MPKPVSEAPARPLPAFTTCVRAFEDEFDYVYRALRRHGVGPTDAEDLAQEVFLVMWRRWADYDRARPLRPWLAGIAFRLAHNHRQRRARESLREVLEVVDDLPGPEEALSSRRARTLVLEVLARLPERHRAAVVLCDLDGLPMPEIAALLGIPLATAYTRVRRARQAFAAEVTREDLAGPAARPLFGGAAALLEIERPPPPAPTLARRRAQARVAALAFRPPARERAGGSEGGAPAWPLAGLPIEVALCGALALLGALPWLPAAAPLAEAGTGPHLLATASFLGDGGPERLPHPPERLRPPMFARDAPSPTAVAAPPSLAEGMAGYWRFDDGRSATYARDLSGRGNDCRLRRLDPLRAWTGGVHGGAIDLRGHGYLECRQHQIPAGLPDQLTVAVWVNRAQVTHYHAAFVTRELAPNDRDDYFFGFRGQDLKVSSSAWSTQTVGRFTGAPGSWNHVAFTHHPDGTTVLYLDGREIAREQSRPRSMPRGGRRLLIGAGHATNTSSLGQDFDGLLDELLVYDRPLAPEEIAALAAGAQPPLSL